MKLLLDTHAFIWLSCEPERLPAPVIDACEDGSNQVLLSVVSILEMEIKSALGRLRLDIPPEEMIRKHQEVNDLHVVPVEASHAFALRRLPPLHKDPFDRILLAQALVEGASLVSGDAALADYPVEIVW